MAGNVIKFPSAPPAEDCAVMCECGCALWHLMMDGSAICGQCGSEPPVVWEWDVEFVDGEIH